MVKLSDFTKNTVILVSGTVIAQAVPLLLHPFLRRMYSAEDFGAMAVYLNLFALITIIASFRYEAAIVLPKKDNESANILSLAVVINMFVALVLMIALLLFKNQISEKINFPLQYSNYLYLLPLACFFFSISQAMNYWLVRKKAFKASASNKVIRRVSEGVVQLGLGIFKIPAGLFIGDFIGNMSNAITCIRQTFKNNFNLKNVSIKKIKFVSVKYNEYPKFNLIPTLLSSAASVLPFLMINKYYSTEVVGYLDLTRLVLSIPLIFISATISQVLFQQITEKKHQSLSIKNEMRNILFLLLGIIIFEIIMIVFLGPYLFGAIFGEKYVLSGFYAQILVYSFVFNFIGSTFSAVYMTFEKIKINSIWQIVYFVAICSLWFFRNLAIDDFLKLYVGIEIVMHLTYCLIIFLIVNKYERSLVNG